jgi:DNA polymerase-1
MEVICDVEADGLNPTVIWCIVCKDVKNGQVYRFSDTSLSNDFNVFARGVSTWIGHNFLGYDGPAITKLLGVVIPDESVIDTLVLSRLLNYGVKGGHSLAAWGERLNHPKIVFNDWTQFSDDMLKYCENDVELTYKLYRRFSPYLVSDAWLPSIQLEHFIASRTNDLTNAGFCYNITNSNNLKLSLGDKLIGLENTFRETFKPRSKLIREVTPKVTKKGTISSVDFRFLPEPRDLSPYVAGAPFSTFKYVDFNPGSNQQCIERLWEYGWQPTEKTDGHKDALYDQDTPKEKLDHYAYYGWKLSEENLATLPEDAPEAARKLAEYLLVSSRYRTLIQWEALVRPSNGLLEGQPAVRIHGTFHHIGSWTHRMAHSEPNMANIPAHLTREGKVAFLGKEFRSLWTVEDGRWLVGTDADGIQLRVLAHYMDDQRFTESLLHGDKDAGTDVHSLNARALGDICRGRTPAKTFIYSWLLGAGVAKTALILGCTDSEARRARDNFVSFYPNLENVKKVQVPKDAERGYFIGFDGRRVFCNSEHLMMAGYLQNGETVLMKLATKLWWDKLIREGIPFTLINFVHDEWVTEAMSEDEAHVIGKIQSDAIREAGEILRLKCPMKGNYRVGKDWYEIH